jgi:hypothetical protein
MKTQAIGHNKLSLADYIGFSPLPVACLLPYFVPNCSTGANLAGFGWTLLASQEISRRASEEGLDLTKRQQLLGVKLALGSLGLSSLYNALSAVTAGNCLSNCTLALAEGFSLYLLWEPGHNAFRRHEPRQHNPFPGKGRRLDE